MTSSIIIVHTGGNKQVNVTVTYGTADVQVVREHILYGPGQYTPAIYLHGDMEVVVVEAPGPPFLEESKDNTWPGSHTK